MSFLAEMRRIHWPPSVLRSVKDSFLTEWRERSRNRKP
ncbi:MAG: GpE family phage tail protein [Proteobacteria bacterium]|nr:GpE family phage tail protein [Pseudomonadota bacterium]